MELVYTNTVDDLVALQLYFFDHDRGLRRLQNLVSMVPAILILILLFLNSQKGGSSLLTLVGMGLAVALALSMRRIIRRRLERSARLSFAHGRGQRTLGKHHLELTEKGIIERTGNGEFAIAWSEITALAETETALFIFRGRGAGMVIPRERVLRGDTQAFAATVRAHTQSD